MPAPLVATFGRIAVLGNVAAVLVTINGSGANYASASGGLPIDLVGVLSQASPFSAPINPADVVGLIPLGLSTNGFLPGGFVAGQPTYSTLPGGSVINPAKQLTSFPATIRLNGIGAASANHSALGEVADGANSDSFSALLLIARGGTNN